MGTLIHCLVATCYDDLAGSGLSADHVNARIALVYAVRYATDSGLRVGFNLSFCFGSAVPRAEEETTVLDTFFKLIVVIALKGVVLQALLSFGKDVLLYL